MDRISITTCYEKKSHNLNVAKRDEKRRYTAIRALYEKYYKFYTNVEESNLSRMIQTSVQAGELACIIFEEHITTEDEEGLSGDDLEAVFEHNIIAGYISISELIRQQVIDFRHVLKFRSVLCRDNLVPVICVQYYLVWRNPETTG